MTTTPDSSSVEAIGWDDDTQKITVVFKTGAVYEYDADESLWSKFQAAASKGQFVHSKDGLKGLPYKKVSQ